MKRIYLFLIFLISLFNLGNAQFCAYKGGYFVKMGKEWHEYRPEDKLYPHTVCKEVSNDENYFYVEANGVKLAIPKSSSVNKYIYGKTTGDWFKCYDIINVYDDNPGYSPKAFVYDNGVFMIIKGIMHRYDNNYKKGNYKEYEIYKTNENFYLIKSNDGEFIGVPRTWYGTFQRYDKKTEKWVDFSKALALYDADSPKAESGNRYNPNEKLMAASNTSKSQTGSVSNTGKSSSGTTAKTSSGNTNKSTTSKITGGQSTSTNKATTGSGSRNTNYAREQNIRRVDKGYGRFEIHETDPHTHYTTVTHYFPCTICQGTLKCADCRGTGRCGLCNGYGYNGNPRFSCVRCFGRRTCRECNGSKICYICNNKSTASKYPGYMRGESKIYNANGVLINSYSPAQDQKRREREFEEKYPKKKKEFCTHCAGTGVDHYPMERSGEGTAYRNSSGVRCPYCASYTWHSHYPCQYCAYD